MKMKYTRTATKKEIDKLTENELNILSVKSRSATVQVDPKTFGAYIVIDSVRYDMEAVAF